MGEPSPSAPEHPAPSAPGEPSGTEATPTTTANPGTTASGVDRPESVDPSVASSQPVESGGASVGPVYAPLAGDLPAERHRLSHRVISYWRWRGFFSGLPLLALLASLAVVIPWGPWWVRWGVVAACALLLALAMIVLPPIRYRVFWYAISPTEIDIQHGIIFIKRSVVPMHRVQNLRTERGPMADHYRMTNLKIKTAAGSVNLSGLARAEADELCDRISRLSDVADDV